MVDVTLSPGRAGPVNVELGIEAGAFDEPVSQEVDVTFAMSAAGIESIRISAHLDEDGLWRAGPMTLPTSGEWEVSLRILISDFESVTLRDTIMLNRRTARICRTHGPVHKNSRRIRAWSRIGAKSLSISEMAEPCGSEAGSSAARASNSRYTTGAHLPNPLVSERSVAEPLCVLVAIARAASRCFQHLALEIIGFLRDLIVRESAASW